MVHHPRLTAGNMVSSSNIQGSAIEYFLLLMIFISETEAGSLPDGYDNVDTDQCVPFSGARGWGHAPACKLHANGWIGVTVTSSALTATGCSLSKC